MVWDPTTVSRLASVRHALIVLRAFYDDLPRITAVFCVLTTANCDVRFELCCLECSSQLQLSPVVSLMLG